MKHNFYMHDAEQGHAVLRRLWEFCKPHLLAGRKLMVTAQETTRTLEQNAKFHAICGDIAKSGHPWMGKARTAEQWKVLLVSGHSVATKQGSDLVPGLEGEFVNLRESTAGMSKSRGASLIEYSLAFCAMHEITTKEPQQEHA